MYTASLRTAAEDVVFQVLTAAATTVGVCPCRAGGVPAWCQPPRCGWAAEAVPHGAARAAADVQVGAAAMGGGDSGVAACLGSVVMPPVSEVFDSYLFLDFKRYGSQLLT
jgi:hypothetical protein